MNLSSAIEAILFIESKPVTLQQLVKLLQTDKATLVTIIQELCQQYEQQQRGIRIVVTENEVQMTSAPEMHDIVTQLVKDERTGELTTPSLETLAIIAYRSPVTKSEIEAIRGVNCSLIIRNLLIRGLIREDFDKTKGVSIYDITPEYLQLLGLSNAAALPDYEHLHRDITLEEHLGEMEQPDDFFQQVADANQTK